MGSGHVPPSRTRNCPVLNVPSPTPGRSGSAGTKQPWAQSGAMGWEPRGNEGQQHPGIQRHLWLPSTRSDTAASSQTLDFSLPGQVLGPLGCSARWDGVVSLTAMGLAQGWDSPTGPISTPKEPEPSSFAIWHCRRAAGRKAEQLLHGFISAIFFS